MTDDERRAQFRKGAVAYLRDPDQFTDAKAQARIADEIEQMEKDIKKLKEEVDTLENRLMYMVEPGYD